MSPVRRTRNPAFAWRERKQSPYRLGPGLGWGGCGHKSEPWRSGRDLFADPDPGNSILGPELRTHYGSNDMLIFSGNFAMTLESMTFFEGADTPPRPLLERVRHVIRKPGSSLIGERVSWRWYQILDGVPRAKRLTPGFSTFRNLRLVRASRL